MDTTDHDEARGGQVDLDEDFDGIAELHGLAQAGFQSGVRGNGSASTGNTANLMLEEPQLSTRMRLGCELLIVTLPIVMSHTNRSGTNACQRLS